ncbi:MAG TPA: hypothetical protein VLG69_00205 [Candidatus Andersenbacteria bacterium]|nr:hypothetical protein [Candidatus Andersenbacteria bacterium]
MWRFTVKEQQGFGGFLNDFLGRGNPQLVNLSVWPWMPIHVLLGEPVGYNTIFLLNMLLSGYAMALFIRILVQEKNICSPAPVIAGIAYMFAPYHIAHSLGHFGAMQLEWVPFILAISVSYIRNPKIWKILTIGILFSIQSWEEHHYALWLAIFAVLACIVYRHDVMRFVSSLYQKKYILSVFLFASIIIIGVIVPYIPTAKLASEDSSAISLGVDQTTRFSSDLFAFITPAPFHPIWGSVFNTLFGQYFTGNESESVQYIGVVILIAILFFKKHIPVYQKRLWYSALILFGLISLGPVLHVFGRITSIPLPYALLVHVPLFSAIRTVSRAGVFVTFSSVVLFGWVIATNIHRLRTSYIIAGFIVLDFLFFPLPTQSAILSPAYLKLASVPGKNIIEIPAATNYVAASRSLYAETIDHKQAVGNIALERGQSMDAFNLVKSVPGVRQLLYLRTTELQQGRPEFFQQGLNETLPDAMQWLNTDAILVHTDSLSPTQVAAVENFLATIPILEKESFGDADLYIRNQNIKAKTDGVFLIRGDGFENVGYDPKRLSTFAEIRTQATISLINILQSAVQIDLSYTVPGESADSLILQDQNGNTIPRTNQTDRPHYKITLQPGQTNFTFINKDTDTAIMQNPTETSTRPL